MEKPGNFRHKEPKTQQEIVKGLPENKIRLAET
jgi:hypothetical protein